MTIKSSAMTDINEPISADNFRIVQDWNGYWHVFELRDNARHFRAWPGPFRFQRAAELLVEDVIDASSKGITDTEQSQFRENAQEIVHTYQEEAKLLAKIEQFGDVEDPRGLAKALVPEPQEEELFYL
ncbi:MAG: hypothetical protein OEN23_04445 [Paracoccaceae bacterium]|nr:hypothetical protein [Paracoccaceae bacterium]